MLHEPSSKDQASKDQAQGPVLLYDGDCGVCTRSVRFVLLHDHRRRTVRFARLRGPVADEIAARHPQIRPIDSIVWYEPAFGPRMERVEVRSGAVLAAFRYLGGRWRMLAGIATLVPRPVRDWGYDGFARIRRRIPGVREVCSLPTPEENARFLDGR